MHCFCTPAGVRFKDLIICFDEPSPPLEQKKLVPKSLEARLRGFFCDVQKLQIFGEQVSRLSLHT